MLPRKGRDLDPGGGVTRTSHRHNETERREKAPGLTDPIDHATNAQTELIRTPPRHAAHRRRALPPPFFDPSPDRPPSHHHHHHHAQGLRPPARGAGGLLRGQPPQRGILPAQVRGGASSGCMQGWGRWRGIDVAWGLSALAEGQADREQLLQVIGVTDRLTDWLTHPIQSISHIHAVDEAARLRVQAREGVRAPPPHLGRQRRSVERVMVGRVVV